MAVRHRIPTIFSIYMVDVLCCALGCVILLWQYNFQEAEKQTAEARARNDELSASLGKLNSAKLSIDALTSEVAHLKIALDSQHKKEVQVTLLLDDTRKALDRAERLALVRKGEYDALKETHALAEAVLEKLRAQYKNLETKSTQTAEALAARIKANAELLARIAEAEGKVRTLEKDLGDRQLAANFAGKKLEEQTGRLSEVERLANLLGKEKIELLSKLKTSDLRVRLLETELTRTQGEGAEAQKKIADLLKSQDTTSQRYLISAKDLETAQAALAALKSENFSLQRRARDVQAAAEHRFAGITLTGRKVIFMVDMSGSMELVEENSPEPDKWPLVCDTIARLMQSLADLQQYQVILFSDKVSYALGRPGQWFDYRSGVDGPYVATRLKEIKPRGATDMYSAFEETFKFRSLGLDTIYVLSDGLPNSGAGMPANAASLTEHQITNTLAKHVRQKLKADWNRAVPNQPRVRINTIGFFYESPDVGAFLWALAREHDGSFVGMSKP